MTRSIRLILVTAFAVAGSVVNFFAQAVLAFRFGAGLQVDAYVFALGLPAFIAGLLALAISFICVPELAKVAGNADRDRAMSSALLVRICLLAMLMILAVVPAVFLQPVILLSGESLLHRAAILKLLIAIGWITGAVQVLNALFLARLNAIGRQVLAAALTSAPGLGSVGLLLALQTEGIWVAAFGTLLGTIAVGVLSFAMQFDSFRLRRGQANAPFEASFRIPQSAWLSVVALTCFSSYAVIDSFWAPRAGPGSLASLGYAQRILIGFGNLIVVGPSALAVPALARMAAAGEKERFRRTTGAMVLIVGAASSACAMLIASFSHPLVTLLFQRGEFDRNAVAQVSSALVHLAPGMAGMLIGAIVLRALFCIPGSIPIAAAIGSGWSVLYFALAGLSVERGITGLADAYSLTWLVVVVMAFAILWHRAGSLVSAEPVRC